MCRNFATDLQCRWLRRDAAAARLRFDAHWPAAGPHLLDSSGTLGSRRALFVRRFELMRPSSNSIFLQMVTGVGGGFAARRNSCGADLRGPWQPSFPDSSVLFFRTRLRLGRRNRNGCRNQVAAQQANHRTLAVRRRREEIFTAEEWIFVMLTPSTSRRGGKDI